MKKCLWCDAENENSAWECQNCGETEFSDTKDPNQYIPGEYDPPSNSRRTEGYHEIDDDNGGEPYVLELLVNMTKEETLENNRRAAAWGGKREGAGSGGARSGAGRKASTLKVKIPPEQIEFLKAEADRLNIPIDDTVSKILGEYINKNQP